MNDPRTARGEAVPTVTACQHRIDVSSWRRRAPIIALSLAGLAIAATLCLFQLHVIDSIWDPFFGDGSRRVLTSRLSRALPVPDAGLGALAYGAEAVLEWTGGPRRALDAPLVVLAGGLVAAGLGVAALGLVVVQAAVVGSFCTLCLTSATISLLIGALAAPETRVALRTIRTRRRLG